MLCKEYKSRPKFPQGYKSWSVYNSNNLVAGELLTYIQKNPECSASTICAALQHKACSIKYNLGRLVKKGLVLKGEGQIPRYRFFK